MNEYTRTPRTEISRLKKRGSYDKDTIHTIIDASMICQVGFVRNGHPVVLPMAYGRLNDKIYLHGAKESPFLKEIASAETVCISIFTLDGLVFARSAFHHSMNFHSVVIYAKAEIMNTEAEKNRGLKALTDRILPGRWEEVRAPSAAELKQTMVLAFPLNEASAKIRTGPPIDSESDMNVPVWAGVVPVSLQAGEAVTDDACRLEVPAGIRQIRI